MNKYDDFTIKTVKNVVKKRGYFALFCEWNANYFCVRSWLISYQSFVKVQYPNLEEPSKNWQNPILRKTRQLKSSIGQLLFFYFKSFLKIPFEIQTRLKTDRSISDEKPNQSNPKEDQKDPDPKKTKIQYWKKNRPNPNLEKKPTRSRSKRKTVQDQVQSKENQRVQIQKKNRPNPRVLKTIQVSPCPNPWKKLNIRNPPAK